MKKYISTINDELVSPVLVGFRSLSLNNPFGSAKAVYRHFITDSLYRNSIYLMGSTFIGAFFGFFFWFVITKIFPPDQIGLATVLISSVTLLSGFSLLGLNLGIVRYLPKSNVKHKQINTVITVVLLSSLFITIVYLLGLDWFAPNLAIIKQNLWTLILFVFIVVFFSMESIYSNVFVALRNSKFVFYKSIITNLFKILSPFILLSFGAYGIFISSTFGPVITFFISLFILYKFLKYKFSFYINKQILSQMFKLSLGNYVASFAARLPLNLLPIMITNTLGAKEAAFYYIDASIIVLLNSIQSSIGQSLFAEGSNNDMNLKEYVFKAIKFNLLILLPAILVFVFLGNYILLFFGKQYSDEGFSLLRLLAISVIFTSINGLLSAILNVKGKVNLILMMCIIGPAILLSLIYFFLPYGLISLGYAWLIGEAIISLVYLFAILFIAR